jgi:SAM-dependent methyltransferase
VVEDVADLWAMERAGVFKGRYHVLGGTLSALDDIGPEDLRIPRLIDRIGDEGVGEVILALNATVDGQTTAHYIAEALEGRVLRDLAGAGRAHRRRTRLSRRRHDLGRAQGGGVHALTPAVGEVPPGPATAADANGGIAKAFFPTEAARAGHYRDLDIILGQLMGRKSFGEVLELGASGGAWTWGLAHDDRVRRLYATETSPAALSHLADITADGAALVLESATEGLGIEMASLDLVVGRGALSREADPTPLLTNVKRWLKPGGAAVFLEPCLQGKIWTAFVMDLIRRFEAQGGPGPAKDEGGGFLGRKSAKKGMSQLATMRLEGAARQVMRGALGEGTGDDRVFDMAALTNLGYEIGYSECYPVDQPQSDVTPLRRMRNALDGLLGQEKSALDRYAPIFEALEQTFGAIPETAPLAPNIYFIFRA